MEEREFPVADASDDSKPHDRNLADDEQTTADATPAKKQINVLKIGVIVALSGVGIFFLITLISLIIYGRAYYYDGYDFTKVFCTIDLILMLSGAVCTAVGLILKKVRKETVLKNALILSITAIALSLICAVVPIVNAIRTSIESSRYGSSYSSGSSGSSYSSGMDYSTYCLLYLNVSNVRVTHSGNYTYVTGSVKNTGTYSVRYVKVRAACKNSAGSVIDTDWTYAVDSDWLEPGESKTFEMMIRDPNNNIRSASVTIVTD